MAFKINEYTGVLIKKAARLYERVANINLDKLGVTLAQTIFLMRLWERDGQTQMELTISAGLKQPTVLRILERMLKEKLIKKVKHKEDKRSHYLFLTEKGKKICATIEPEGEMMQKIATASFTQNRAKQINRDLSEIIQNLQVFIDENEC